MPRHPLLDEVNKRLTLNLLIQGSAQHAFLTSHYLVRDELMAIDPSLIRLYDKFALGGLLQYWYGEFVVFLGWPPRFWRRAATHPRHPFHRHKLLSTYGGMLSAATKRRADERARAKGLLRWPGVFSFHLTWILLRIVMKERRRHQALIELAKRATHMIWGIEPDRLEARLTRRVEFGELRIPKTFAGNLMRGAAAGYGGVLRRGAEMTVVARAWIWPLISHELVKGTVELICLHGLNELDERTYRRVVRLADRIEHEPWMLQAGAELWRRLLPLLPGDRPAAEMLMHIARLPPKPLETLMIAVIEQPAWAKELLAGLGAGEEEG